MADSIVVPSYLLVPADGSWVSAHLPLKEVAETSWAETEAIADVRYAD